jgi:hypothetical protein
MMVMMIATTPSVKASRRALSMAQILGAFSWLSHYQITGYSSALPGRSVARTASTVARGAKLGVCWFRGRAREQ